MKSPGRSTTPAPRRRSTNPAPSASSPPQREHEQAHEDARFGAGESKEGAKIAAALEGRDAGEPTHADVARRAYEIYLARGETPGSAEEDWQQAERDLRRKP